MLGEIVEWGDPKGIKAVINEKHSLAIMSTNYLL